MLTKIEKDVLHAQIIDARTLRPEDLEPMFRSYREQIDNEMCKAGLESYSDEDWTFLHTFYVLFFREGFNYAFERQVQTLDNISDYIKTHE